MTSASVAAAMTQIPAGKATGARRRFSRTKPPSRSERRIAGVTSAPTASATTEGSACTLSLPAGARCAHPGRQDRVRARLRTERPLAPAGEREDEGGVAGELVDVVDA